MDSIQQRLIKALDYLKELNPSLGNPGISKALKYRSDNYVADIIRGQKAINQIFLEKLKLEYSINPDWVLSGKGEMIVREDNSGSDSKPDMMLILLNRIATLTNTQNLILQQNQVQIVGGIQEIKAGVLLNRDETAARASAIKGQIEELGRKIHQDIQKFSQVVPSKRQDKILGKSDGTIGKRGSHVD